LDRDEVRPRLEPTNLTQLNTLTVKRCPAGGRQVLMDLGTDQIDVASDQELLTLALAQLLDNALKYAPPQHAIRISLASTDDMAIVRVSNHGSFIPVSERGRVFDRFYRGTGACELTPGAGLGLYVARKIALAHGGGLDLEEYAPDGSETAFCLKVPIFKIEPRHARKAS
jgi:two-component system sensor histidine kinase KdpD